MSCAVSCPLLWHVFRAELCPVSYPVPCPVLCPVLCAISCAGSCPVMCHVFRTVLCPASCLVSCPVSFVFVALLCVLSLPSSILYIVHISVPLLYRFSYHGLFLLTFFYHPVLFTASYSNSCSFLSSWAYPLILYLLMSYFLPYIWWHVLCPVSRPVSCFCSKCSILIEYFIILSYICVEF
jgi:hypothetical protein